MVEKIIHYVSGGWKGLAYVKAACNATVTCEQASSLFTNCQKCKIQLKQRLKVVTNRVDYE